MTATIPTVFFNTKKCFGLSNVALHLHFLIHVLSMPSIRICKLGEQPCFPRHHSVAESTTKCVAQPDTPDAFAEQGERFRYGQLVLDALVFPMCELRISLIGSLCLAVRRR